MQYGDEYWHSLEKSSKKYNCPSCGKKRFTYYRDNYGTGEIIDPAVGMCERLNSCGYHFAPREYFEQTGQKPKSREYQNPANRPIMPQKKPGRLSFDKYVKPTLQLKKLSSQ